MRFPILCLLERNKTSLVCFKILNQNLANTCSHFSRLCDFSSRDLSGVKDRRSNLRECNVFILEISNVILWGVLLTWRVHYENIAPSWRKMFLEPEHFWLLFSLIIILRGGSGMQIFVFLDLVQ